MSSLSSSAPLKSLKVLSYWNLNVLNSNSKNKIFSFKYYHIGILLQKNRRGDK